MSVHDETWDKCKTCKKVIKSWQYEYHEKYCKDYSYGEYLNLKNGYPAKKIKSFDPIELIPEQKTIWRTDQPKPFDNGGWYEDPSNLMFPKLKEPQKQNFLILWTSFGQYEFVQDYPADPHEYAWSHDKYKISPYIIIPIDKLPKKFKQTPEDDLLDKTFGKQ